MKLWPVSLLLSLIVFPAFSQETPRLQNPAANTLEQNQEIWRQRAQNGSILPEITSNISPAAAQNITGAEQIFCYQVAFPPENYTGYTIDNFAVTGFCGIVNPELKNMILSELFMNPDNLDFNHTEDCEISPKIMLRFFRGVDSTDVVLSSPCHSYAVIYGGNITAFNAKPSAMMIDALIDPLVRGRVEFASPALLNQLLPIGVAQTPEQKDLLSRQNEPIRKWQQQEQEKTEKANAGWNKINLKLQ